MTNRNYHSKFQLKRLYVLLPILLAVSMLAGVWGTTAVYAAAPVIPSGQTFTVNENSATGTTVGTVAAIDADSFSIVGGNSSGAFDINVFLRFDNCGRWDPN